MATYKLIQDIEAEDHVLGPLSLQQFIFALIGAFCFYMCFLGFTKHIYPLLIIFLPVALFFGFFAFPFGRDQPTEIWALAKLHFLFKPRKRIWDQSGIKELVTITVPKKEEPILTDGLSQTEVKSRLRALAKTLDSRGWAVRGVDTGNSSSPLETSDRLVDAAAIVPAKEVPGYEEKMSDDVLDETNNPVAHKLDEMIAKSEQDRRQELIERMNSASSARQEIADSYSKPPAVDSRESLVPTDNGRQNTGGSQPSADYWFMNPAAANDSRPGKSTAGQSQVQQPSGDMFGSDQPQLSDSVVQAADESEEDIELIEKLKARNAAQPSANTHLKTIQPLGTISSTQSSVVSDQSTEPTDDGGQTTDNISQPAAADVPAPIDPVILSLASNNDLNVSTLGREANRAKQGRLSTDEVVITLH